MKLLYFDCFSGISGDMALAALADAGADRAFILDGLNKLGADPFQIAWRQVNKQGIQSLKADISIDEAASSHHRHYADIVEMIERAGIDGRAAAYSLDIFKKIGEAEAQIHGIPLSQVHFHEVGAMDSIIDVVGMSLALVSLDIDRIVASPVAVGCGMMYCQHGRYPVPAPATLELLKGWELAPSPHRAELTTPTGAGIIAALARECSPSLPRMKLAAIGYGAGTRDLPNQPNVLRVCTGTVADELWPGGKSRHEHHHDHHHHAHQHHHRHQPDAPHAHTDDHEHTHDRPRRDAAAHGVSP